MVSRTEAQMSDEYETPQCLFAWLCAKYDVKPTLDVAANVRNTKCPRFLVDGLNQEWDRDAWCNPPHNKKEINGKVKSQTEMFVKKAYEQWKKHNINIIMIIPANSICTHYAKKYTEGAEFHPIYGRPRFLVNGVPSEDSARNSYFVVIWRKT